MYSRSNAFEKGKTLQTTTDPHDATILACARVGGDEFEMDLLFYHVILHRYVVIELKTGKFQPKDIGQLGFYMTAIDRQVKSQVDGKTIGIVLCRSRNDIVAEYALADLDKPIGVSTYQLGLPPLEQLQKKLQQVLSLPKKKGRS